MYFYMKGESHDHNLCNFIQEIILYNRNKKFNKSAIK